MGLATKYRQRLTIFRGEADAGIEPGPGQPAQPVHALIEPELQDAEHREPNPRLVEVVVRLMVEEPVPKVGAGDRIPGPIRWLDLVEDHPRVAIAPIGVAPDVEVTRRQSARRGA